MSEMYTPNMLVMVFNSQKWLKSSKVFWLKCDRILELIRIIIFFFNLLWNSLIPHLFIKLKSFFYCFSLIFLSSFCYKTISWANFLFLYIYFVFFVYIDIADNFRENLKVLVPYMLASENLNLKEVNGKKITCKELLEYFKVHFTYIVFYSFIKCYSYLEDNFQTTL